jgi:hypothetical protein
MGIVTLIFVRGAPEGRDGVRKAWRAAPPSKARAHEVPVAVSGRFFRSMR